MRQQACGRVGKKANVTKSHTRWKDVESQNHSHPEGTWLTEEEMRFAICPIVLRNFEERWVVEHLEVS